MSMSVPIQVSRTADSNRRVLRTIVALIDDTIDTEHVLADLRKSNLPAEQISVIIRERVLNSGPTFSEQTSLSRVVAASALVAVSGWLRGLATLVLSDRAAYLVAGPIGVLLASIREAVSDVADDVADTERDVDLVNRQLMRALSAFGFPTDQAGYLEQRVVAGSTLIAITSADVDYLRAAQEIFSRWTAVHLGLARTDRSVSSAAERLLETGLRSDNDSVVVVDAAAPLVRLSEQGFETVNRLGMIGKPVTSATGTILGAITEVLLDAAIDEGAQTPKIRYVIANGRGRFGFRRWTVAVPYEAVKSFGPAIVLNELASELNDAPRYEPLRPLSRQDEVTIRRHFRAPHYWLEHRRFSEK